MPSPDLPAWPEGREAAIRAEEDKGMMVKVNGARTVEAEVTSDEEARTFALAVGRWLQEARPNPELVSIDYQTEERMPSVAGMRQTAIRYATVFLAHGDILRA